VSDNTVGKKIREAEKMKIPYILVIGDKEMGGSDLAIRKRGTKETMALNKQDFMKLVVKESRERSA
jgi:threonyl-tRNA synthetase